MFFDIGKVVGELDKGEFKNVSEEEFKRLDALANEVDFLKMCSKFLTAIDSAIDVMIKLLKTTSVSDMHEAIQFFITAYQYNIDRVSDGILGKINIIF